MNAFTSPPIIRFSKKENAKLVREVTQPPRFSLYSIAANDPVAEAAEKAIRFSQGSRPPRPEVKRWSDKKGQS